jgi:hypothetical protein
MRKTRWLAVLPIIALVGYLALRNVLAGPPSQTTVTFHPGWANVPYVGLTMPIDQALGPILPSIAAVYYVDNATGAWQRYFPNNAAASNLTTLTFAHSYLMLFTGTVTVEMITEDMLYGPPPTTAPSDLPGQSLCQLLDELDDLRWSDLNTASAIDCGPALECTVQCDLDSGFERDVDAVASFLSKSLPIDLSLWKLKHCVGALYFP